MHHLLLTDLAGEQGMKFDELYPNFRYEDLFTLIKHTGDSLNDRSNRFDKANLFESAIAHASHGKLEWVDEEGCDLHDPLNDIKYEVKSLKGCLYTKARGDLRKSTGDIKLTNTLQQGDKKTLSATADYLVIIDSYHLAMAIISYHEVVEEFSTELKDGFKCNVPIDRLEILAEKSSDTIKCDYDKKSYAKRKEMMQEAYVGEFFRGEEE
jgi:hypothetical protein